MNQFSVAKFPFDKKQLAQLVLGPIVGIMLVAGCSGTKGIRITDSNKEKLMQQISNNKDLTVGEVQLLQGYVFRSALSGHELLPTGKTVGELIDEQRKFVSESEKRDAEEKQRVAKAKVIADEKRKMLLGVLNVTEFEKGFERVSYQDYNTMKFSYENKSSKDIRGFKGMVIYKDLFGDEITKVELKEDRTMKSGQTIQVNKQVDYNQFMEKDVKLKTTSLENMKVSWEPDIILFTDGTSLSADAE